MHPIMTNAMKEEIYVNGGQIEFVNEYIYLGQLISPENTIKMETISRIANSWKRFWTLSERIEICPLKTKEKSMTLISFHVYRMDAKPGH